MKQTDFPKDFLWGASTAGHQVEGGLHNQWTVWEKANAERLAREAPQRFTPLPNWEDHIAAASQPENYISGKGVEHYARYPEDINILKDLNMNAFRFGIEWSRVEPEPGKWDESAIAHYRAEIAALQKQGIEPIPTLWHWSMPVWFAEMGGFEKRANVAHFVRFAEKCSQELAGDLHYLITLNEPNTYVAISYIAGEWPPAKKSTLLALKAMRNLTVAHNQAYKILKQDHPQLQVGIAMNMSDSIPLQRNPVGHAVVRLKDYTWNWWFVNRIRRHQDFVGLNYYMTTYHHWNYKKGNPKEPRNDLGWFMEPSGIYPLLLKVWKRYKKPIIVTENGLADSKDQYRQWWLQETIAAMRKALQSGVDLRGYLHWSLLDNFEWSYGWWPKFGLVAVDRETMQRTIRPSAKWFAKQIKTFRGSQQD